MAPFNPSTIDDDTKRSTPGLEAAYDYANMAETSGYDLETWGALLRSSEDQGIITIDSSDDNKGIEDLSGDDPELWHAIKLSLRDHKLQKARCTSTLNNNTKLSQLHFGMSKSPPSADEQEVLRRRPFQSPPGLLPLGLSPLPKTHLSDYRTPTAKRPSSSPSDSEDDNKPPVQRRKLRCDSLGSQGSYKSFVDEDKHEPRSKPQRWGSSATSKGIAQTCFPQQVPFRSRNSIASGLSTQKVFPGNGFNAPSSTTPTSDIIEEDL